jgi:hypothetical protein
MRTIPLLLCLAAATSSSSWAAQSTKDAKGPALPSDPPSFAEARPTTQNGPLPILGVEIQSVVPKGMAERSGVKAGDRIVAINGWRTDDWITVALMRESWLPPDRDEEVWSVVRGGQLVDLRIPAMSPARVGVNFAIATLDSAIVDQLIEQFRLKASALDRQMLAFFPGRAARLILAAVAKHPEKVWVLRRTLDLYLALSEDVEIPAPADKAGDSGAAGSPKPTGKPPTAGADAKSSPSAPDDPMAFLGRLETFYHRVAEQGAHDPTPAYFGEDAYFIAAYYPHPANGGLVGGGDAAAAAALGHLQLSDKLLMKCLQERIERGDDVSPEAQAAAISENSDDSDDVVWYLGGLKAALINPPRMGGWPYRGIMVVDPARRDRVIDALTKRLDGAGDDAPLIALALVGAYANRGAWDDVAAMVARVAAASPYLGEVGREIALALPRYRNDQATITLLEEKFAPVLPSHEVSHGGLYRYAFAHSPQLKELDGRGYDPRTGLPFLFRDHSPQLARLLANPGAQDTDATWAAVCGRLDKAATACATYTGLRDASHALPVALSLRRALWHLTKLDYASYDAVARCYAVARDFPRAQTWAEACAALGSGDIARQAKADAEAFVQGKTPEVPSAATTTQTETENGVSWTGLQAEGKRVGHWTGSKSQHPVEEGLYFAGQRTGWWLTYHPNGKVATEAIYADGKLVGAWRSLREDGSVDCVGWYDGEGDGDAGRIGEWTWYHPTLKRKACGSFVLGKRDGHWRTWHENGQLASEGDYALDDRVGLWHWYDAAGKETAAPPPAEGKKGDF